MNTRLELVEDDHAVEIGVAGRGRLFRYTYNPDTSADEAPRPYAHPVCTLGGEALTAFRPEDHPWHHGLSFTICSVDGWNFWGGPSYRAADGYQWRADHGRQVHRQWRLLKAEQLEHSVEWRSGKGEPLLDEQRRLDLTLESSAAWSLRWRAALRNVSGRELTLSQYHAGPGLVGSHYTGLQFAVARDLQDEGGNAGIGIRNTDGLEGEAVHGSLASWIEWNARKADSRRRLLARFANNGGPLHWFVRRQNPLITFSFHYDRDVLLPAGASLNIDHTLIFAD